MFPFVQALLFLTLLRHADMLALFVSTSSVYFIKYYILM